MDYETTCASADARAARLEVLGTVLMPCDPSPCLAVGQDSENVQPKSLTDSNLWCAETLCETDESAEETPDSSRARGSEEAASQEGESAQPTVAGATEGTCDKTRERSLVDGRDHRAVWRGRLVVTTPSGTRLNVNVCFDSGSEVDAVSLAFARKLRLQGVAWGEPGGRLVVADGGSVDPIGTLRVLCTAEAKRDTHGEALALPTDVSFVTDVDIVDGLTSEMIIGWPTMSGTGLLNVILGTEQYELSADTDRDELEQLWPDEVHGDEYTMPEVQTHLSAEEAQRCADLCTEFKVLFGKPPHGGSKLPPMGITLKDENDRPPRQSPRQVAPWIADLIKQDTDMRLKNGWYRRPKPHEVLDVSSPVVAAKQPSKGEHARRICVDVTKVNDKAKMHSWPVKNQQEVLRRIAGKKYFCKLDMLKGYHQVKLEDDAAKLLTVATPHGLFVPVTCPFGFHGLPAYFQQMISQNVLGDLDGHGVESFLDDMLVCGDTFEEMLANLRKVFERLEAWNLRLNGAKCEMNLREAVFLGHLVDGQGHRHTDKRVEGLEKMQRPFDRTQLKSFLGLVNYFREHLGADFAEITKPLNDLTGKGAHFIWTIDCQRAFDLVKARIIAHPKLYFIDYSKPIFIRTDASKVGCGAQLFQVVDGQERPISFISRTFTPAEQKWSTLEQELFAAVWAVKKWRSMLEGQHFCIQTDHKNILHLASAEAAKVVRWRLAMQNFDYEVIHVPGVDAKHMVADCLSRLHGPVPNGQLSANAMTRSQSAAARAVPQKEGLANSVDSLGEETLTVSVDTSVSSDASAAPTRDEGKAWPTQPQGEPRGCHDFTLGHGTPLHHTRPRATEGEAKTTGTTPSALAGSAGELPRDYQSNEGALLASGCDPTSSGAQRSSRSSVERTIMKKGTRKPNRKAQIVSGLATLEPEIVKAIRTAHNELVGHFGVKRTQHTLRRLYDEHRIAVLPSRDEIEQYIKYCPLCQKLASSKKALPVARSSLMTMHPFQEVSIDVIGPFAETDDKMTHVIVVIDNFSKYVFAEPCKGTTAEAAARFILKLGAEWGWPRAIRFDNASQFDSHLVKRLLELLGVERHPSVPYAPQTNGIVERSIKEIIRHLKVLVNERRNKKDWNLFLPIVLRLINTAPHGTIGLSPAQILKPGIDLDRGMYPEKGYENIPAQLHEIDDAKQRKYIGDWLQHLGRLQKHAILSAGKYSDSVQQQVQRRAPEETREFKIGSYVVTPWRGGKPDKLSTTFRGPYEVVEQTSSNMYRVRDVADDHVYDRHVQELYEYKLAAYDDPVDIIAMDKAEDVVDCIVDHHREEGSTSKYDYDFRVRFKGGDDLWLPYKECTRAGGLEAFWKYVAEHPELGIKLRA